MLCRSWQNRVKGRDFYDYVWYLSRGTPVNIKHLTGRLRQTGHWHSEQILSHEQLLDLLISKLTQIDFVQARKDVLPFIKDKESLGLWSKDFFIDITRRLLKLPGPG